MNNICLDTIEKIDIDKLSIGKKKYIIGIDENNNLIKTDNQWKTL